MSKEIKITKELIQKAKAVKSAEELKALAKADEIEISDEQAADMFSKLNTSGELADDELEAVVGGGCTNEGTKVGTCSCGGSIKDYFDSYTGQVQYYQCNSCGARYASKDEFK